MAITRTINRLIDAILSDILNVYHPSESIDDADAKTVYHAIEDQLAGWVDYLDVPVTTTLNCSMINGTDSYTVGQSSSPSITAIRPDKIIGAYVSQGGYDYPVEIITESQYRNIIDKSTTGRPTRLYPLYGTPNITFYLHPTPDSTDKIYLVCLSPMAELSNYTQDTFVTLGLPGYIYNALKWRVAINVAPGFAKSSTPEMTANAMESYNHMVSKHLARNMKGAGLEIGGRKKGAYSLSDFFAGE